MGEETLEIVEQFKQDHPEKFIEIEGESPSCRISEWCIDFRQQKWTTSAPKRSIVAKSYQIEANKGFYEDFIKQTKENQLIVKTKDRLTIIDVGEDW